MAPLGGGALIPKSAEKFRFPRQISEKFRVPKAAIREMKGRVVGNLFEEILYEAHSADFLWWDHHPTSHVASPALCNPTRGLGPAQHICAVIKVILWARDVKGAIPTVLSRGLVMDREVTKPVSSYIVRNAMRQMYKLPQVPAMEITTATVVITTGRIILAKISSRSRISDSAVFLICSFATSPLLTFEYFSRGRGTITRSE